MQIYCIVRSGTTVFKSRPSLKVSLLVGAPKMIFLTLNPVRAQWVDLAVARHFRRYPSTSSEIAERCEEAFPPIYWHIIQLI